MAGLKKSGPARRLPKRRRLRGDGRSCAYCGRPLYVGTGAVDSRTIDHVIPHSRGGRMKVFACWQCNHTKGSMSPDAWLAWIIKNKPERAEAVRSVYRSLKIKWVEPTGSVDRENDHATSSGLTVRIT